MTRVDINQLREQEEAIREVRAVLDAEQGFANFVCGIIFLGNVVVGLAQPVVLVVTIPISILICGIVVMFKRVLYKATMVFLGLLFLGFLGFLAYIFIQAAMKSGLN
jgi:hypothetical protein